MADIKDLLDKLEKVRLAPILIPVLKVSDPLMGSLPKGTVKSMLSRKGTQDGLVKTVEGLAPLLPTLIRFAGHLAESKLATGALSLWANITTPIMKPLYPVTARLVVPSVGPSLKLVNALIPVLPAMVRVSDGFLRIEVSLERIFRGGTSK